MNAPAPPLHATEEAAAGPIPTHGGLAALFTTHILRDGELVLLIRKPSLWFIPLQSLPVAALIVAVAVSLAAIAAAAHGRVRSTDRFYLEAALFLIAGRLTWASLQWMGRLYVLTNQRILRLSGVFGTDVFDCPLRKIAHLRRTATLRERILGLGSILILPADRHPALWQTVAKPAGVHEEIAAAINRARQ